MVVVIGRPIHRIWQVLLYVMLLLVNVILLRCKCHNAAPAATMLEIAAGHQPLSYKFQHMADQNLFWLAKLTIYFQWKGNK